MYILGISAHYHDAAAALIKNDRILAAAQEERFSRKKHDPSFPSNAIDYCLNEAGIHIQDVDYVVFYEKPFLKFERLLETYLKFVPVGFISFSKAIPVWIKEKLFQKYLLLKKLRMLDEGFSKEKLLFSEHHMSHAASAFFASPFEEALILTMDGVGEWTSTSLAVGRGADIRILKEIDFPNSLGLLYSAFTYYCGFKVNSGEYKLMGLAPYGKPEYAELITSTLIDVKEDGSFRLNQKYFNYCVGLTMTNKRFSSLFGHPVRQQDEQLTQFHMDVAASIQIVIEDIVIKLAHSAHKETGLKNMCLAGGVALNCVANGKLLKKGIFDEIWIQPAAGDAGGALGCALAAYHMHLRKPRCPVRPDSMRGSYLGPSYNADTVWAELQAAGAISHQMSHDEVINWTTNQLVNDKVVGWFQGRMEFGPRALGRRSILANPKSHLMQKQLNLKIKYRESFRPFAPAITIEDLEAWFELDVASPYMLMVSSVREEHCRKLTDEERKVTGIDGLNINRSLIPAVTHVDYSARIQTVHSETNPEFHSLISKFKEKTGCPILVNTSFNIRGEPMVCTPRDAFRCFMGTDMDALVIGDYILKKEDQNQDLAKDYKNTFELD